MAPPPFQPSPDQADRLLTLYLDPSYTLHDLAREAGATLPALASWLASPEVAAQLDAIEQATARRTRALAAEHLPAAVPLLAAILADHARTNLPADPELRRRAHETTRRAATLLTRLARFTPGPTRAPSAIAIPARPRATSTPRSPNLPSAAAPASHTPNAAPSPTTPAAAPTPAQAPPLPADFADALDEALGDPQVIAILEQLAQLPDDAPPQEVQRLTTALFASPPLRSSLLGSTLLREAG